MAVQWSMASSTKFITLITQPIEKNLIQSTELVAKLSTSLLWRTGESPVVKDEPFEIIEQEDKSDDGWLLV
jgi:hypothetical protein